MCKYIQHLTRQTDIAETLPLLMDDAIAASNLIEPMLILQSPRALCMGPGAVVKAASLQSRRSRVLLPLWHSSIKQITRFISAYS